MWSRSQWFHPSHYSKAVARWLIACVCTLSWAAAARAQGGTDQDKPVGNVHDEKQSDGQEEKRDDDKHGVEKLGPVPTIDIVRAALEPAYIGYPFGFSGLDRLVFESNVVAHFVVHQPSWPIAFVLTPKVLVRMFAEDSAPVKSPSYMPRIAAYFWFDKEAPRNKAVFYGSLLLSHHSNGQSESFFDDKGNIRHDRGSFSTNFFELSAYLTGLSDRWFGWSTLSLEWHPGFNEDPELRGRYGLTRLHFATTLLAQLPFQGELSLSFTAILDDFMHTATNKVMRALERFPISVRYELQPPHTDLGLYISYYLGHDYYNIYFDRIIHTIQVGISGSVTPTLTNDS